MCEILEQSKFPMTIKRRTSHQFKSILLVHKAILGTCFVHCTDTVAFANDSSIRNCFAPCYWIGLQFSIGLPTCEQKGRYVRSENRDWKISMSGLFLILIGSVNKRCGWKQDRVQSNQYLSDPPGADLTVVFSSFSSSSSFSIPL